MNRFLRVDQDLKKYRHFPTGSTAMTASRYARGQQANGPVCDAAQREFTRFSETVGWLDTELRKPNPANDRLQSLRELVRIGVERILEELPDYIPQRCCEPHLQALERQVRQLPWHTGYASVAERDRLIDAIREQQRRARNDYQHC